MMLRDPFEIPALLEVQARREVQGSRVPVVSMVW
jgi:hypothetical protein